MTTADLLDFTRGLALDTKAAIAAAVSSAIGEVNVRLASLQAQLDGVKALAPVVGPPGQDGRDGLPGPQGPAGRDVDFGQVQKAIADAVAVEVERAMTAFRKDWRDPNPPDLSGPILATVTKALADLPRPTDGRDGKDGAPGRDGTSVTLADVQPMIDAAVKALPPAPPGKDGTSVTLDDVRPLVDAATARAVAVAIKAMPLPKDGLNGLDGKSLTPDDIRPIVLAEVRAAVAALPPPLPGRDGLPGVPGPPGEKGLDGLHGKDGLNGTDGKAGADGIGFDQLDLTFDQSTGFVLHVTAADGRTKDWPLPIVWDAGVWRTGHKYPTGAGTTKDGSYWIAQEPTLSRPGESKAWRMAVRRGTDGRPGKDLGIAP